MAGRTIYWDAIVGDNWPVITAADWGALEMVLRNGAAAIDLGGPEQARQDFDARVRASAALQPVKDDMLAQQGNSRAVVHAMRTAANLLQDFSDLIHRTRNHILDVVDRAADGIAALPRTAAAEPRGVQIHDMVAAARAEVDDVVSSALQTIDPHWNRVRAEITQLLGQQHLPISDAPLESTAASPGTFAVSPSVPADGGAGHVAESHISATGSAAAVDAVRPLVGQDHATPGSMVALPDGGAGHIVGSHISTTPSVSGVVDSAGSIAGQYHSYTSDVLGDVMSAQHRPDDSVFSAGPSHTPVTQANPSEGDGSPQRPVSAEWGVVDGGAGGDINYDGAQEISAHHGGALGGGGVPSPGTSSPSSTGVSAPDAGGFGLIFLPISLAPQGDSTTDPPQGGPPARRNDSVAEPGPETRIAEPEASEPARLGDSTNYAAAAVDRRMLRPEQEVSPESGPGDAPRHRPPGRGDSGHGTGLGADDASGHRVDSSGSRGARRVDTGSTRGSAEMIRTAVGGAMAVAATPSFEVGGVRVDGDLVLARTILAGILAAVESSWTGVGFAVAVMRHPGGVGAFLTSNEGRGWLPAGLYLPREMSTPWRWQTAKYPAWEGISDPARVLAEFGPVWGRKVGGRLSALASSLPIEPSMRAQLADVALADRVAAAATMPLAAASPGLVDRLGLVGSPRLLARIERVPAHLIGASCVELAQDAHDRVGRLGSGAGETLGAPTLRARVLAAIRSGREVPGQWWDDLRDIDDLLAATVLARRVDVAGVPLGELRSDSRRFRPDLATLRAMVFQRRCNELALPLALPLDRQSLRDAVFAHGQIVDHPALTIDVSPNPLPRPGEGT